MEKSERGMDISWNNDKLKLADKGDIRTGMRASEIPGPRVCDVRKNSIHVYHA